MNINQESTLPPADRLIELVQSVSHLHMGRMPLVKLDLSMSQMALLRWIASSPGCHVQEIAEGMGLSAPTVSVGVRRLVEAGLLERRPDTLDKRATCIFLSKKGKKMQQHFLIKRQEEVHKLLAGLTSEEQNQLLQLLEKAFASILAKKSETINTEERI